MVGGVMLYLLDLSVEVDSHYKTVEPQHLGEDEDQDHTDEEARLLGCPAHAGISNNADCEASS